MKLSKKIAAALLAVLTMSISIAGCGNSSSSSAASASTSDSAESVAVQDGKVYNIGICQFVQHDALDAATKGFKDYLTEKLGDNVKFDDQNAQGDSANCTTIINGFVANNVDLILANATPPLQAAYTATETIPILGTSVTHYGTALDIADWKGYTEINVSGTADLAPLDEQAALFKELLPNVKTIGLLYCSAEANSKYQIDTIKPFIEKDGYTTKEYTFSDSNDIAAVVTSACDECDALYIPTDNTAASNANIIDNIALEKKIPVIAGEEGICGGCGIATLSISYYDLGTKTGEMAYDILVNGKDISKMEIQFAPTTKKYDAERCQELGITVPEDYVAIEKSSK